MEVRPFLKKLLFIVIVILSSNLQAFSQRNKLEIIDSLLALLPFAEEDTNKAVILRKLSGFYTDINVDEGIKYGEQSAKLAEKLGWRQGVALVYNNLANNYLVKADYKSALQYYFQALDINIEIDDKLNIGRNYGNIGVVYNNIDDEYKALEYYEKAAKIFEEIDFKYGVAVTGGNIGSIYCGLHDFNQALEYYNKAIEICIEINDSTELACNYANIGTVYGLQGLFEKSLDYFLIALDVYEKIGNKRNTALYLTNIGNTYINMVETNIKKKKFTNKYFNGNTAENLRIAESYLNRGLELQKEVGDINAMQINYFGFSQIYELRGDYKKSLEFFKKHITLKDSIFSLENKKKIAYIESEKAINDRDKTIRIQNLEIENQRNQTYIFAAIIIIIFLILLVIIVLYRNNRNNNKILAEKNRIIINTNIELEYLNDMLGSQNAQISNQNDQLEKLNKDLNDANAAKDKFFSIIAHDLKNPIQSLILTTDLLLNFYDRLTKEKIIDKINIINDITKNISSLLENLLNWSRSITGMISFNPEYLNISNTIACSFDLLNKLAEIKHISIDNLIDQESCAYFDKYMIDTVFRNLVSNAIKYSENGSHILIESQVINADNNRRFIELAVSDNGLGIKEEDLAKLFHIGVHHTTVGTNKEFGTGLGLILCKEFVEKHRGTISVESKYGKGSTFRFTLPVNSEQDFKD